MWYAESFSDVLCRFKNIKTFYSLLFKGWIKHFFKIIILRNMHAWVLCLKWFPLYYAWLRIQVFPYCFYFAKKQLEKHDFELRESQWKCRRCKKGFSRVLSSKEPPSYVHGAVHRAPGSRFLCRKRETAREHSVHRLHSFSCVFTVTS